MSEKTKAVILVGGLGTRLRPVVASKPKPIAQVGDRSFLELLICQLRSQGIREVVLCTGYLANEIEKEFRDGSGLGVTIEYSKEPHPMGTGGAVKLAEPLLRNASDFLVMNGDSFMEISFSKMLETHRESGAMITMAVLRMRNENRYGTVQMNASDQVIGFTEKGVANSEGFVNAGIYVFSSRVFDYIPDGKVSLENDVFPNLLSQGIHASRQEGIFIDIGTPEDYARAQNLSKRLYEMVGQSPSAQHSCE
jgi:NDP-sugar pyrophosphorylase family protein